MRGRAAAAIRPPCGQALYVSMSCGETGCSLGREAISARPALPRQPSSSSTPRAPPGCGARFVSQVRVRLWVWVRQCAMLSVARRRRRTRIAVARRCAIADSLPRCGARQEHIYAHGNQIESMAKKKWLSYPRMDTGASSASYSCPPGSEIMESRFAPWINILLTMLLFLAYRTYAQDTASVPVMPAVEAAKPSFRLPWQK